MTLAEPRQQFFHFPNRVVPECYISHNRHRPTDPPCPALGCRRVGRLWKKSHHYEPPKDKSNSYISTMHQINMKRMICKDKQPRLLKGSEVTLSSSSSTLTPLIYEIPQSKTNSLKPQTNALPAAESQPFLFVPVVHTAYDNLQKLPVLVPKPPIVTPSLPGSPPVSNQLPSYVPIPISNQSLVCNAKSSNAKPSQSNPSLQTPQPLAPNPVANEVTSSKPSSSPKPITPPVLTLPSASQQAASYQASTPVRIFSSLPPLLSPSATPTSTTSTAIPLLPSTIPDPENPTPSSPEEEVNPADACTLDLPELDSQDIKATFVGWIDSLTQ
eukprot:TRINITY_DN13891_c0_g1::TRINITY_DN13891_c0_g1_i1::g.15440::m.15440 TRINITY_DN13891_c0_g1::TRINITY_DN13891_c0_g1_i1::g.15440  ORF type:complete len:351 (-),score=3.50,sp/P12255/FHAB_BORPE/27.75/5e-09 TRINITY_DN13891_c0_g1_i1:21-1004(-)